MLESVRNDVTFEYLHDKIKSETVQQTTLVYQVAVIKRTWENVIVKIVYLCTIDLCKQVLMNKNILK